MMRFKKSKKGASVEDASAEETAPEDEIKPASFSVPGLTHVATQLAREETLQRSPGTHRSLSPPPIYTLDDIRKNVRALSPGADHFMRSVTPSPDMHPTGAPQTARSATPASDSEMETPGSMMDLDGGDAISMGIPESTVEVGKKKKKKKGVFASLKVPKAFKGGSRSKSKKGDVDDALENISNIGDISTPPSGLTLRGNDEDSDASSRPPTRSSALRQKLAEVEQQRENLEAERDSLQLILESKDMSIKQLKEEVETFERKLVTMAPESRSPKASGKLDDLAFQITLLNKELAHEKEEHQRLQQEMEQLQKELAAAKKEYATLREELRRFKDEAAATEKSLRERLAHGEENLRKALEGAGADANSQVTALLDEMNRVNNELLAAQLETTNLQTELTSLNSSTDLEEQLKHLNRVRQRTLTFMTDPHLTIQERLEAVQAQVVSVHAEFEETRHTNVAIDEAVKAVEADMRLLCGLLADVETARVESSKIDASYQQLRALLDKELINKEVQCSSDTGSPGSTTDSETPYVAKVSKGLETLRAAAVEGASSQVQELRGKVSELENLLQTSEAKARSKPSSKRKCHVLMKAQQIEERGDDELVLISSLELKQMRQDLQAESDNRMRALEDLKNEMTSAQDQERAECMERFERERDDWRKALAERELESQELKNHLSSLQSSRPPKRRSVCKMDVGSVSTGETENEMESAIVKKLEQTNERQAEMLGEAQLTISELKAALGEARGRLDELEAEAEASEKELAEAQANVLRLKAEMDTLTVKHHEELAKVEADTIQRERRHDLEIEKIYQQHAVALDEIQTASRQELADLQRRLLAEQGQAFSVQSVSKAHLEKHNSDPGHIEREDVSSYDNSSATSSDMDSIHLTRKKKSTALTTECGRLCATVGNIPDDDREGVLSRVAALTQDTPPHGTPRWQLKIDELNEKLCATERGLASARSRLFAQEQELHALREREAQVTKAAEECMSRGFRFSPSSSKFTRSVSVYRAHRPPPIEAAQGLPAISSAGESQCDSVHTSGSRDEMLPQPSPTRWSRENSNAHLETVAKELQDELGRRDAVISEMQADKASREATLVEWKNRCDALQAEIEQWRHKITEQEQIVKEKEAELIEVAKNTTLENDQRIQDRLRAQKSEIECLKTIISTNKESTDALIQSMEEERAKWESANQVLVEDLEAEKRAMIAEYETSIEGLKTESKNLKVQMAEREAALSSLQTEYQNLRAERDLLQSTNMNFRAHCDQLSLEVNELRDELETAHDQLSKASMNIEQEKTLSQQLHAETLRAIKQAITEHEPFSFEDANANTTEAGDTGDGDSRTLDFTAASDGPAVLQKEISKLQRLHERDARRFADRIAELEREQNMDRSLLAERETALAEAESAIRALKQEVSGEGSQKEKLSQQLSETQSKVSTLTTQLLAKEAELDQAVSDLQRALQESDQHKSRALHLSTTDDEGKKHLMNEAETAREAENLARRELEKTRKELGEVRRELESLQDECRMMKQKLDELNESNAAQATLLVAKEREIDNNQSLFAFEREALKRELSSREARLEKLVETLESNEETISAWKDRAQAAEFEQKDLEKRLAQLESGMERARKQAESQRIRELDKELDELHNERRSLNSIVNAKAIELSKVVNELEILKLKYEGMERSNEDLQQQLKNAAERGTEISTALSSKEQKLQKQIIELTNAKDIQQLQLETYETREGDMRKSINNLKDELESLTDKYSTIKKELSASQVECNILERKVEEYRRENEQLKSLNDELKATSSSVLHDHLKSTHQVSLEVTSLRAKTQELERINFDMERELTLLRDRVKDLDSYKSTNHVDLETLKARLRESVASLREAEQRLSESVTQVQTLKTSLQDAYQREQQLNDEVQGLRRGTFKSEMRMSRANIMAESNSESEALPVMSVGPPAAIVFSNVVASVGQEGLTTVRTPDGTLEVVICIKKRLIETLFETKIPRNPNGAMMGGVFKDVFNDTHGRKSLREAESRPEVLRVLSRVKNLWKLSEDMRLALVQGDPSLASLYQSSRTTHADWESTLETLRGSAEIIEIRNQELEKLCGSYSAALDEARGLAKLDREKAKSIVSTLKNKLKSTEEMRKQCEAERDALLTQTTRLQEQITSLIEERQKQTLPGTPVVPRYTSGGGQPLNFQPRPIQSQPLPQEIPLPVYLRDATSTPMRTTPLTQTVVRPILRTSPLSSNLATGDNRHAASKVVGYNQTIGHASVITR